MYKDIVSKFSSYSSIVFDCDGVILKSNSIKSDAFYASALHYGTHYAADLVSYHKSHGGISRYKKFDHFLQNILMMSPLDIKYSDCREELLAKFSSFSFSALLQCPSAIRALEILRAYSSALVCILWIRSR